MSYLPKIPILLLSSFQMIIDPVANNLGPKPPHSGEHSSSVQTADMGHADVSLKSPRDPPPPYTEFEGFEPLTEAIGPRPSDPRTLSR